jgi:hypothetical protein
MSRSCIEKSSLCPICDASFYKKEKHLSLMIREAITYTDEITKLINEVNSEPLGHYSDNDSAAESPGLPDLNLTNIPLNELKSNLKMYI